MRLTHNPFCMQITSVGMLGLDTAWAPFTPFAHVPLIVTVGAVKDTVVAIDGAPAVRPMLTLAATLDHRYMDGAGGAVLAKVVRSMLGQPELMEQKY